MHMCLQMTLCMRNKGKNRARGLTESPPGSKYHTQSPSLRAYSKKSQSFTEHMC